MYCMKISDCKSAFTVVYILCACFFCACNQQPEKNIPKITDAADQKEKNIQGNFSNQQELFIDSSQLKSFFKTYPGLDNYASDVKQFYNYRHFLYAWYNKSGLVEQASTLYNDLNNGELEGIQSKLPYKASLDSMLEDLQTVDAPNPELEILLTAEYLFYADKVWNGISEKNTEKLEWLLPRKKLNLPFITDSLLKDSSSKLFDKRYNFRQYGLLQNQLKKYRDLAAAGLWDSISMNVKEIKKLDSSEVVKAIRHRLFLLGDLESDAQNAIFDNRLEEAVLSFQERNGMEPDGRIGNGFIKEINSSPAENMRRIIINMERTRWIPTDLSDHYLIINIPAFSLYAFDKDTMSFQMNVVVGKEVHKTVIFSGDMKYIVFSPYWNVPASIMKSEVLPAIRKNPNYLKKNNMEWNGNTIRQKPGPKNSLGLVKFLFPNTHNIYLHDSPAKSLFGATSRAFSHGCIRLAEPKKLAVYLLKDDAKWTEEKIDKAMHAGVEKFVTLNKPVPVFIGYLTAWVDNGGRLNFRKDIYDRDQPLEEMITR